MSFLSWPYLALWALTWLALRLRNTLPWQQAVVLVASYVFYAAWDWRWCGLLLGLSWGNHALALAIHRAPSPRAKDRWLALALGLDLGVLAAFKYLLFFWVSAQGWHLVGAFPWTVVLPVAISFITFEVISYVIDVRRGDWVPSEDFREVALLVAFFPHLISGPILKPSQFLPQWRQGLRPGPHDLNEGLWLFGQGALKKLLIADAVAPFVDAVYADPTAYSPDTIALAILAYGLQIYGDFSGYSDMAWGTARSFGLTLPPNFRTPYLATNLSDFWRRWHTSLSSWLRDYLYLPLGGNRAGEPWTTRNQLVVMVLGGLWHGANWTFVAWGTCHGLGLAAHKLWRGIRPEAWTQRAVYRLTAWALTLATVLLLWVPFRSPSFDIAAQVYGQWLGLGQEATLRWWPSALVGALFWTVAGHFAWWWGWPRAPWPLWSFRGAMAGALGLWAMLMLAPERSSPFIYFQF